MNFRSVVLVPADAPPLRALAEAVCEGVASSAEAVGASIVVVDPAAAVPAAALAPLIFLGDVSPPEGLPRFTEVILPHLLANSSAVPRLARFHLGPEIPPTARSTFRPPAKYSPSLEPWFLGPPEEFRVDLRAGIASLTRGERARARRWAARTFIRSRNVTTETNDAGRAVTVAGRTPRSVPWCGATE